MTFITDRGFAELQILNMWHLSLVESNSETVKLAYFFNLLEYLDKILH